MRERGKEKERFFSYRRVIGTANVCQRSLGSRTRSLRAIVLLSTGRRSMKSEKKTRENYTRGIRELRRWDEAGRKRRDPSRPRYLRTTPISSGLLAESPPPRIGHSSQIRAATLT